MTAAQLQSARLSEVVEGRRIAKRPAQGVRPGRQTTELEVLSPRRILRENAERLRGLESEARVERHVAQQDDTRLVQGVGRRQDAERTEAEYRPATDVAPAADNMPDNVAVPHGDQCQARHHVAVMAKFVNQSRFGSDAAACRRERCRVYMVDSNSVTSCFAAKDHPSQRAGRTAGNAT
jgi:hypothetical protein